MEFGGDWTVKKLEVIENYLDAYTTALKKQRFRLIYIDAFAGDGTVTLETPDSEFRRVVDGSARLALEVNDKQFDRLVFVEQDGERCKELRKLRLNFIPKTQANSFFQNQLREINLPIYWKQSSPGPHPAERRPWLARPSAGLAGGTRADRLGPA